MTPLVSTLCEGPLGVAHLPRFWWKNLLHQAGELDEAYPYCSGGLDTHVLGVLELDKEQTLRHLWEQKPNYLQFEAWIGEHGTVHRPSITRWNTSLGGRTHYIPAKIDETYDDIGFDKEEVVEVSRVLLNCLQDWQLFHRNGLTGDAIKGAVPPTLSSIDRGRLGMCQLPRTWLKTCLRARGLLHDDYPDCADGSLDQRGINTLKLDQEKTLAFLRDSLPTYLEFEDWVAQEGEVDTQAIQAFNTRLLEREHRPEKIEDIHSTLGREQTWTSGVLLNNLEDWHYAHHVLTAS